MVFKIKTLIGRRQYRRYIRFLTQLIMVALIFWIVMFVSYAYAYQIEIKKELDKVLNKKDLDNSFKLRGININFSSIKDIRDGKIIDAKSLKFYQRVQRQTYNVNCQKLIEWDENEVKNSKQIIFKLKHLYNIEHKNFVIPNNTMSIPVLPDVNFIFDKSMCKLFKDLRGYDNYKIHPFEYTFPIAYTILTYDNVEQFERLLQSTYRPQNVYCVHVDLKSVRTFHKAIESITNCFSNVFISTKLEHIVYAGFNRLKADLNCMHDLFFPNYTNPNLADKNLTTNWKYLLNTASTEFPLRTNYEITRILHMFNGANDIEWIANFQRERIKYSWIVKKQDNPFKEYMVRTKRLKSQVPHNYTIVKGLAYCLFSFQFVKYVLTNQYAIDLLKWSQDTYSPDEW